MVGNTASVHSEGVWENGHVLKTILTDLLLGNVIPKHDWSCPLKLRRTAVQACEPKEASCLNIGIHIDGQILSEVFLDQHWQMPNIV